jgi:hypothetical protein
LGRTEHYWTRDEGVSWIKFETNHPVSTKGSSILSFHPGSLDNVIIHVNNCQNSDCRDDAFYTLDSFKNSKLLLPWISSCVWAQAINKDLPLRDKVFCLQWPDHEQKGDVSWKDPGSLQLVSSHNYFEKEKQTITVGGGVPVLGLTPYWLVGIVKANEAGYKLITSKDGSDFVSSSFSDKTEHIQSLAFSILESSNTTLFVDVVSSMPGRQLPMPFGTLYVSNSDGSHFSLSLEHTNRDLATGMVDFEHIQSTIYEGVLLANTVKNWREILDRKTVIKDLTSYMSYDNGRRWGLIRPPEKDNEGKPFGCITKDPITTDCSLHLHSVTTSKNVGRVFSVSSAPGIIIGVGSVGPKLNPYEQSDTFISEDSGVTWKHVQKGPHKFEILNLGSIIALIPDGSSSSDHILYSTNRGRTWQKYDLKVDGSSWMPLFTILDPESLSSTLLVALSKQNFIGDKYLVQIDFSKQYSRVCSSDKKESNGDLEVWKLEAPQGRCVLGASVSHYRRKADAECSMDHKFGNGMILNGPCACTDYDFECERGFTLDSSATAPKCVPSGVINDQPLDCKVGTKYKGLSGYRKVPGNQCKGGDEKKVDPIWKDCRDGPSKPPSEPKSKLSTFGDLLVEIVQVPHSPVSIMLNREGIVWRSSDFGATWNKVETPQKIVRILFHETKKDRLFLFSDDKIYLSDDALATPKSLLALNTPEPYNNLGVPVIDFHPSKTDWYTFVGSDRNCGNSNPCHTKAYITKDNGKTFTFIDSWVGKCVWVRDVKFQVKEYPEDAVFCMSYKIKDGKVNQDKTIPSKDKPMNLVLITRDGKSMVPLMDANVLDFFVVNSIMLVATNEIADPILFSSIDGQQFKKVSFPPNIKLQKNSFTLVPSKEGGVYLDIAQSVGSGIEYGILFKSNQNGQFFSRILANSNRGSGNEVDFQKFPGLEGISIANTVTNAEYLSSGVPKNIASLISFDDGSTWASITAPKVDVNNNPIDCTGTCSLHLHLESDIKMNRMLAPFGTEGSAGLLVAVGNVGESLGPYNSGNMYLTRDGGQNWNEIHKGTFLWTIADYGGLLVLVEDQKATDSVTYSWDFGRSWAKHKFSDLSMTIESIVAHEGSNKVVLTGHYSTTTKDETVAVFVDFGSLFTRKCDIAKASGSKDDDFEEWTPSHENGCFFGQKVTYLRRLASSICSIEDGFVARKPSSQTCECSLRDFECDYNFFRNSAGECVLYGIDPEQPSGCVDGTTYKGSSGYRKIALSKCSGGKDYAAPVDRQCGEQAGPENVKMSTYFFDAPVDDFFYFKASGTIMVKDTAHNVYLSDDEGLHWKKVVLDPKETINAIVQDPYHTSRAFIITSSSDVWVTGDVGKSFQKVTTVGPPDVTLTPNFVVTHPKYANWIIWLGSSECEGFNPKCHTIAQVSWDAGKSWSVLTTYAQSCQWGTTSTFRSKSEKTIFCSVYAPQAGNQRTLVRLTLMRSDSGDSNFVSLFEINGFAFEDEYLIAAVVFLFHVAKIRHKRSFHSCFHGW